MIGAPTILCIDDEDLGLRVRRIVLERAGYHVLTAAEGTSGIAIFISTSVDGVVLDYAMPGMNGLEVAQVMRDRKPDVPILLHSAYVTLPPEAHSIADCVLTKGSGPQELLTAVNQLVRKERNP